jgi:hypothetical protein
MTIPRILGALALVAGLSACANPEVTRSGLPGPLGLLTGGAGPSTATPAATAPAWSVAEVRVWVPRALSVTEANLYYPLGDIIWHGDPAGDRREQVRTVLEEGLRAEADALAAEAGDAALPEVIVEAELTRFHALTPVARATVGGLHTVAFNLTLRDADSGVVLDGPRSVRLDIPAAGGSRARRQDAEGLTQRVVITRHIGGRMVQELSAAAPAPTALSRLEGGPQAAMVLSLR